MNVYITKINGLSMWNPKQYSQWMTAEIAYQMGFREMGIFCYNGSGESDESLRSRIDGIIAGLSWGEDVVICQFPTGNGFRYEWELVNRLKIYQGRVVIFIQDSEAVVREPNLGGHSETIRLYNRADVLIVPSLAMRQFLLEHGIRNDMKFVIQEMWDYTIGMNFFTSPQFRKEIHVTGIGKIGGVDHWNHSLPLKWYADSTIQGENVHHIKGLPQSELIFELSKGGFGLVWYQDAESRCGMEYSASFELSQYLAAGIPVIVPNGISNQKVIEKNHLGLVIDSLEEAVSAIEVMTEKEYKEYIGSVGQFAPILRNGCFTKRCLIEAVQAMHRKDKGKMSIPMRIYDLGNHVFSYVILKESYGGNLALSWNYYGETDGFLIYDTTGKLIYETRNKDLHYFLIKGYREMDGFSVKSYVDTLKGKLILAESELVYLQEEKYDYARVSLIIPAYNAEDYIVRSIDTALAQSFYSLEIIIVDDGSTDQTRNIIDWYTKKYSNVKTIYKENGGAASARNLGIKCAGGEYIGFLDNDDMIRSDMVAKMYDLAKANDCDIIITSVYKIKDNGCDMWLEYPIEDGVITVESFFQIHFQQGMLLSPVIWNKLYRSSLVKAHIFPEILAEDEAWTPYILSYADKICYYNEGFYEYDRVIRNGTFVNQVLSKPKDELFGIIKKAVIFYLKNGNPNRIELLMQHTKMLLLLAANLYSYDQYEKLWYQIEEKCGKINGISNE